MFEPGDGNERCPGEESCERFQSAAGANRKEKALNACTGCHLLPTKIQTVADESLTATASTIERLRQEQRAGRQIGMDEITALRWEGLIAWHELESQYERAQAAQISALLRALMTRGL